MKRKIAMVLVLMMALLPSFAAVLSLNKVDYVSNDPDLNKPAWLVYTVADVLGSSSETIVGEFSSEQIKDETDKVSSEYDFEIDISPTPQQCVWSRAGGTMTILAGPLKYEEEPYFADNCVEDETWYEVYQRCQDYINRGGICILRAKAEGPGLCYYLFIYGDRVGTAYDLSETGLQYGAKMTLKVSGQPDASVTLSNMLGTNTQSAKISGFLKTVTGTKVAFAELSGSLSTGRVCPFSYVTDQYMTMTLIGVGNFLIEKYLIDYLGQDFNDLVMKADEWQDRTSVWTDISFVDVGGTAVLEKYNEDLDEIIKSRKTLAYFSVGGESYTLKISSDGQKATTTLIGYLIDYPTVKLKIWAEWIGVKVLVPEPFIKDITTSGDKLSTNVPLPVYVTVGNNGETGSVAVELSCQDISVLPSRNTYTIPKGGEYTFEFTLTSASTSSGYKTCTVTVYPTEKPEKVITTHFPS